ncbi:hypothetical protein [Streptomyces sp. NPDC054863]
MTAPAPELGTRYMEAAELNNLLLRTQFKQGADLKVLMYFATAVPVGHPVRSTATEIGRLVGLSTTSASRSIGRLVENEWLQLSYTAAGLRFYRLGTRATGEQPAPAPLRGPERPLAVIHNLRGPGKP